MRSSGTTSVDRQVAVRDRGEADEARHLDVLRADPVPAAAEPPDAADRGARSTRSRRSRAPSETRKRQRSWTCGSQAALPITVSPGVSTAAMTAFSVAITLASSRKIGRAAKAGRRAHLVAPADLDRRAEPLERVDVRVEPPPADHVAARRRHARTAEAREQRPREQERGADAARRAPRRARATRARPRRPAPRSDRSIGRGAEALDQLDHRLDVADARHVRQRHRLVGEQASPRGSAARRSCCRRPEPPGERLPALDHERFGPDAVTRAPWRPARLAAPWSPTREQAWQTLTRYTKSESLLRHALAVEASTAAYARSFGEDEELWRVAALLHDFDYEMHPTLDGIRRTARRSCARRATRRRSSRPCSRTPSTSGCRATRR